MATPYERECEKYHIFQTPFVLSCECRTPKYLLSSGKCEGCLKAFTQNLICSFRDLVCAHPEIPSENQEILWTWIMSIIYPASVIRAHAGLTTPG